MCTDKSHPRRECQTSLNQSEAPEIKRSVAVWDQSRRSRWTHLCLGWRGILKVYDPGYSLCLHRWAAKLLYPGLASSTIRVFDGATASPALKVVRRWVLIIDFCLIYADTYARKWWIFSNSLGLNWASVFCILLESSASLAILALLAPRLLLNLLSI